MLDNCGSYVRILLLDVLIFKRVIIIKVQMKMMALDYETCLGCTDFLAITMIAKLQLMMEAVHIQ